MANKRIYELTEIAATGVTSDFLIVVDASGQSTASSLPIDEIAGIILPSQSGNTGKYLQTVDGSLLWEEVVASGGGDSLPDQTGNNGKYLKTDGTNSSWETVSGSGLGYGWTVTDGDWSAEPDENKSIRISNNNDSSPTFIQLGGTVYDRIITRGSIAGSGGLTLETLPSGSMTEHTPRITMYRNELIYDDIGNYIAGEIIIQGGFEQPNYNDNSPGNVVIRAGSADNDNTGSGYADVKLVGISNTMPARLNVHGYKPNGFNNVESFYALDNITETSNVIAIVGGDNTGYEGEGDVYVIAGQGSAHLHLRGGRGEDGGEVPEPGGNVLITPGGPVDGNYVLIGIDEAIDNGDNYIKLSDESIVNNVVNKYYVNGRGVSTNVGFNHYNDADELASSINFGAAEGGEVRLDIISDNIVQVSGNATEIYGETVTISGENTTFIGDSFSIASKDVDLGSGAMNMNKSTAGLIDYAGLVGDGIFTFGSGDLDVVVSAGFSQEAIGQDGYGGSLVLSSAGGSKQGGPALLISNDYLFIGTANEQVGGNGSGNNYINISTGGGYDGTNYDGHVLIKTGNPSSDYYGYYEVKTDATDCRFTMYGNDKKQVEILASEGVYIGSGNTGSGDYSVAIGVGGKLSQYHQGEVVRANGYFNTPGDAQEMQLPVLRGSGSGIYSIPNEDFGWMMPYPSTWALSCLAVTQSLDGTKQAAYKIEGCYSATGGGSASGNYTKTAIYESDASWDITLINEDDAFRFEMDSGSNSSRCVVSGKAVQVIVP